MSSLKDRLDNLLVARGLCESRAKAQRIILAGHVLVNGQRIDKPGQTIRTSAETNIALLQQPQPFVSRGGLKLEKALSAFSINPLNMICMDVGASTGGFTHCLLDKGAKRVYAIDVGYGQLAWSLRQNPDVIVLERTNVRHMSPDTIADPIDLVTIDVSFISLKKVLPNISHIMTNQPPPNATQQIVALLKPQFEYLDYLPEKKRQFRGIVETESLPTLLEGVLSDLESLLPQWDLKNLILSPIQGAKGNIEFLLHFSHSASNNNTHSKNPWFCRQQVSEILNSVTA